METSTKEVRSKDLNPKDKWKWLESAITGFAEAGSTPGRSRGRLATSSLCSVCTAPKISSRKVHEKKSKILVWSPKCKTGSLVTQAFSLPWEAWLGGKSVDYSHGVETMVTGSLCDSRPAISPPWALGPHLQMWGLMPVSSCNVQWHLKDTVESYLAVFSFILYPW